MKQHNQVISIIRSCSVDEYVRRIKDDNLIKSEFILVLVLLTFLSNIRLFIDNNIFKLGNEFNIATSLSLIIISYLIYYGLAEAISNKSNYEVKLRLLIFSLSFFILLGVLLIHEHELIRFDQIISFDYDSI